MNKDLTGNLTGKDMDSKEKNVGGRQVALITGGTSGIGLQTAKKFLEHDFTVVVCSNDRPEKVEAALNELNRFGEVEYFVLDVANQAICEQVTTAVCERFEHIDILVNAAGIIGSLKPLVDMEISDIHHTIDIDFMGSIRMAYAVACKMRERRSGVIINISSISGAMVTNSGIGYHASKAGIDMATKVIAKAVAPYGIRCVAVAPGSVNTGMHPKELIGQAAALMLRNRMIESEEIAGIVYLLSLNEASVVNGTTIMADDGFTAWKTLHAT